MKTKTFLIILTVLVIVSCKKKDTVNNNNQIDDVIEFSGDYPTPESIEYIENGITYHVHAIPGHIVISTDVNHTTVVNAVNGNGGTIIEQYPQFGLYTIEVTPGHENIFLTAMDNLNISADLNIVEYPKSRYDYYVFDDFADANGIQHGRKVSNILKECQNNAIINEVNNVVKLIIPLNYTNVLLWNKLLSQDMVLVNWSHGYGSQSDDWQNMSPTEKENYKTGWKKSVIRKLDQIIRLKKKNPKIDIVFAHAAGNEKCPEIAQMINDIKSNPQYKTILEENMIFVSDYSYYANTGSVYGDFCYIKEHPYYEPNGGTTSFATPQALCYINQVIKLTVGKDGKNITAIQALAAVKAAIKQNSEGEFVLEEALEMARIMYSCIFSGTQFANTSWNVSISGQFFENGIRRVRESHNNPNGSVYYTYHNETYNETGNNLGPLMPVFTYDKLVLFKDDYGEESFRFSNDTIYLTLIMGDESAIVAFVNGETNGNITISRDLVTDSSFNLKIESSVINDEQYGSVYGYRYKSDQEVLYCFTINNNNECSIDNYVNEDYKVLDYGSDFVGKLQYIYNGRMSGNGIWEQVDDNDRIARIDCDIVENSFMRLFGLKEKK